MITVAATVFFVWLALARDKGWAWIPAAIFGFQVAQNVFEGGGSLFFPVLVIAAGILLLSRGHLSRQAIIGILVILAIVGIAADDHSHDDESEKTAPAKKTIPTEVATERSELPELKGRRLVVASNRADVSVSRSASRRATVDRDAEFKITEGEELVLVELSDLGAALDLRVPSESRLTVDTNSGDVNATVNGFGLEVDTNSGDVDIDLEGEHPVTAETLAGQISAEGVDDEDQSPAKLVTSGPGLPVTIETFAGDISIEQD
ncbi:MAG: DUF4097 domain-containing protein [Actinobacteria bacterium]|nr:DUF4097 domain-containing protein [Actinomycetota bacterium]